MSPGVTHFPGDPWALCGANDGTVTLVLKEVDCTNCLVRFDMLLEEGLDPAKTILILPKVPQ